MQAVWRDTWYGPCPACSLFLNDNEYFIAWTSEAGGRAAADDFCKSMGGAFSGAGTVRHSGLPPQFLGQQSAWWTYDPAIGKVGFLVVRDSKAILGGRMHSLLHDIWA